MFGLFAVLFWLTLTSFIIYALPRQLQQEKKERAQRAVREGAGYSWYNFHLPTLDLPEGEPR